MAKDPAKQKKDKKKGSGDGDGGSASTRPRILIPIAHPLADDKLSKKVLKLAKRAAKRKQIKRGVKEVVKALRKGGGAGTFCIIAADISPLDVIAHLPILCEDKAVPYVYVRSKDDLGGAGLTKRPTSCMLVSPVPGGKKPVAPVEDDEGEDFGEAFKDVRGRVVAVQRAA